MQTTIMMGTMNKTQNKWMRMGIPSLLNRAERGIDVDRNILGLERDVWAVGQGGLNVMKLDRFARGVLLLKRLSVLLRFKRFWGWYFSAFGQVLRRRIVKRKRRGVRESGVQKRDRNRKTIEK
jgi:hypothetical protein